MTSQPHLSDPDYTITQLVFKAILLIIYCTKILLFHWKEKHSGPLQVIHSLRGTVRSDWLSPGSLPRGWDYGEFQYCMRTPDEVRLLCCSAVTYCSCGMIPDLSVTGVMGVIGVMGVMG